MSETGLVAGKVAIITGGAGAIGREIAFLMAKEGASVVVNDIGASLTGMGADTGPAHDVAQQIRASGGKAIANTLNIADPANAEAIIGDALSAFGRVDILVNNAGILRDGFFHKLSSSDWNDVIEVHLTGAFNLSRAAATQFRSQGGGSFIHMTSTSALIGQRAQANYCAAKLGLAGLSRSIALDMEPFGVRSNAVAPLAWSRMISSIKAETEAEKARVEKMRRMTPDKIAPLVVYLGSDRADGVSGQIFVVRNNEIFLMSQPRPIRTLHTSDGWTPEKLDQMLKPAMQSSFVPLEISGQVFSWDPV